MKNEEKIKDEERSTIKIVAKSASSSRLCILPGRRVGQAPYILRGICFLKNQFFYFYQGLSAVVLPSAFVGALRSTPQPPYIHSSFARPFFYGGFAGYLLLSPSPSAVESLWGFYHTITSHRNPG